MDFASILSAEYADAMLKKAHLRTSTPPIGTGPYVLQQYKVDSLIRYVANPNYWEGPVPTKHLIFPSRQTWRPVWRNCKPMSARSFLRHLRCSLTSLRTTKPDAALRRCAERGVSGAQYRENRLITCWCAQALNYATDKRPSLTPSLWAPVRSRNPQFRQI